MSDPAEAAAMSKAARTVVLRLNRQQLELLDRTIARGVAPDRESLIRLALREYAAAHAGTDAGAGRR